MRFFIDKDGDYWVVNPQGGALLLLDFKWQRPNTEFDMDIDDFESARVQWEFKELKLVES